MLYNRAALVFGVFVGGKSDHEGVAPVEERGQYPLFSPQPVLSPLGCGRERGV